MQNKVDQNDYEFDSINEASLGESLSRISWRHFSIKNKLFTKKFVNIDNNKKILIDIGKFENTTLELSLSYAVYLIEYFFKKKISFALKYNDYTSEYSNSLKHKNNLLKYTANV